MSPIPVDDHDLFEKETIAHVATQFPDGTPHVTPVWIDYDPARELLLVNTERGRQKERNVARDPRVGASMVDPDDPYRSLSVVGDATTTSEGARAHIDELARRYTGSAYANPIETERVLIEIQPTQVF